MPTVENDRIVQTKNEARAGTSGHGVRYVLIFGTAGVVILFGIIYMYYFAA